MNETILELFKQFLCLPRNFHDTTQMLNNHLDHRNDQYFNDSPNEDHMIKNEVDKFELSNLFQNYSQQCYYIQQYIPSPLMLFTWSKLLRTEIFQKSIQNIISLNCSNIIDNLQSTDHLLNNTNVDITELTNKNSLIQDYLNKLDTLLLEYLSTIKDWRSTSSSSYSTEPIHLLDTTCNDYELKQCLHEWLNQSTNYHRDHYDTPIKDINYENDPTINSSNNPSYKESYLYHQMNNRNIHIDNKDYVNACITSMNIPKFHYSKYQQDWLNPCIELNDNRLKYTIQRKSSPDTTTTKMSPPSSSTSSTSSSPSSLTNYSFINNHSIINSSLNKTNLNNEQIIQKSIFYQPLTKVIHSTTSYSPPLNFNELTFNENMLCPLCYKCFRFEKNLLRHLQKTHSTSTGESLLKCKLCNYTTKHYSNMYVHIRTHTELRSN
ncbi:zinc finger protein [Schistosoma japonicum]|uniref:Zinc finger protein n=1 Tax=Schistosoma japonicum TaxID=6182 RepID=A0A4Z2DDG5_SCHJA|nr:zinc finger protein [Schistosoma japonicum]